MNILRLPKKLYFKPGSMPVALKELDEVYGIERAFVISSLSSRQQGFMEEVDSWISSRGIRTCGYYAPAAYPTADDIDGGIQKLSEFRPQAIVAVGDSCVIDTAKLMWKKYGDSDIRLIFVQQGAGRCSSCSPFALYTDEKGKISWEKDYCFLPEIAVIDSRYFGEMDSTGLLKEAAEVLDNAVNVFTADDSGNYVQAMAREAAWQVIDNLDAASGADNKAESARYHIANAAALAAAAHGSSASGDTLIYSITAIGLGEKQLRDHYKELVKTAYSVIGR